MGVVRQPGVGYHRRERYADRRSLELTDPVPSLWRILVLVIRLGRGRASVGCCFG